MSVVNSQPVSYLQTDPRWRCEGGILHDDQHGRLGLNADRLWALEVLRKKQQEQQ